MLGCVPEPAAPAVTGSARERILETAYELFSRHGIRAVGVDTIIATSGVAKMSLYRHFSSKDELVLEFLQERERRWTEQWLRAQVEARAEDGAWPAAGHLRCLRRVVPAGGLRGLLVHQRAPRV